MTNPTYITATDLGDNCWVVEAKLADGSWVWFDAPRKYEFYSEQEAREIASHVQANLGAFNAEHWARAHRDDMTIRDMEDEYYSRGE